MAPDKLIISLGSTKPKRPPLRVLNRGTATEWGNSRLSEFEHCPRSYYHRYVEGIVPVELSMGLDRGTAFHAGLRAYYEGRSASEIKAAVAKASFSEEARDRAQRLVNAYTVHYRKEKAKVLGVETFHSATFKRDGYVDLTLTTRYDLIVKFTDGVRWSEHKTASRVTTHGGAKYDFNPQLAQGCAIWAEVGPPKSLCVPRGIKLPKRLVPRVNIAYDKKEPDFDRHDHFYHDWILRVLVLGRFEFARERSFYAETYGENEPWPQRMSSCASGEYGLCDYWSLCSTNGNARDLYINVERPSRVGGDGGRR